MVPAWPFFIGRPGCVRSRALILSLSKEDLALLVDREDERLVWGVEVKAHDVLDFVDEVLVVRQLEGFHQMRLQPMRLPDLLHAGVADADGLGHRAHAPMRSRRRFLVQRLLHHPLDHRRRQRRLAPGARGISPQAGKPVRHIPILPAIDRPLALAHRAHDRHLAGAFRRQQHDPSAPNQLLWRVPVSHPTVQRRPIFRR
jgi:hypothetical protein